VLKQFAANFGTRVEQLQASQSAGSASMQSAGAASAATFGSSTSAPAPEPTQLNALALLWGMLRDWFKSLFGTSRG
jgi:hypothetical protein